MKKEELVVGSTHANSCFLDIFLYMFKVMLLLDHHVFRAFS